MGQAGPRDPGRRRRDPLLGTEQASLPRRPRTIRAEERRRGLHRRRPAVRADRGRRWPATTHPTPGTPGSPSRPSCNPAAHQLEAPMPDHGLSYLANCSMLFTERPLLDRPAAAKAAGFDAVEFWWPWPDQPGARRRRRRRVRASDSRRRRAAGRTELLRRRSGRPGLRRAVDPQSFGAVPRQHRRRRRHRRAARGRCVQRALRQPGRRRLPRRAGRARPGEPRPRRAGRRPHRRDRPGRGRERTEAVSVAHRRRRGRGRAGGAQRRPAERRFLCDLFHLANNGDDLDAAIAQHADVISHVQIADCPGRGEPGSGELDLDRYLAALVDRGYAGWVGLEYKPTTDTETSLAWLPRPDAPRRTRSANQQGARS